MTDNESDLRDMFTDDEILGIRYRTAAEAARGRYKDYDHVVETYFDRLKSNDSMMEAVQADAENAGDPAEFVYRLAQSAQDSDLYDGGH